MSAPNSILTFTHARSLMKELAFSYTASLAVIRGTEISRLVHCRGISHGTGAIPVCPCSRESLWEAAIWGGLKSAFSNSGRAPQAPRVARHVAWFQGTLRPYHSKPYYATTPAGYLRTAVLLNHQRNRAKVGSRVNRISRATIQVDWGP